MNELLAALALFGIPAYGCWSYWLGIRAGKRQARKEMQA